MRQTAPVQKPAARHVMVRTTLDRGLFHEVVRGITDYASQHGPWELHLDPVLQHRSGWFDVWYRDADGILCASSPEEIAQLLHTRRVPIVRLGVADADCPSVQFDDFAVGEMAYAHLRDLGLRTIAFCGAPGLLFSDQRLAGVTRAARRNGTPILVYPGSVLAARAREGDETGRFITWLVQLPRPSGLIAATTGTAHDVATFCRFRGIRIPEDIALLGIDPDDLTSELSTPQLSYLDQGARRLGFEAAALLDRLMKGGSPPGDPVYVPPKGVVARRSTDVLAVDDPELAHALRFVRDHAYERLTVKQILRAVPMARRTLERGFLRVLGRTVHDEITRLRIERAKHMLTETNLSMPRIAAACGFEHASSLSAVFTKVCGISAREYRKQPPASSWPEWSSGGEEHRDH